MLSTWDLHEVKWQKETCTKTELGDDLGCNSDLEDEKHLLCGARLLSVLNHCLSATYFVYCAVSGFRITC